MTDGGLNRLPGSEMCRERLQRRPIPWSRPRKPPDSWSQAALACIERHVGDSAGSIEEDVYRMITRLKPIAAEQDDTAPADTTAQPAQRDAATMDGRRRGGLPPLLKPLHPPHTASRHLSTTYVPEPRCRSCFAHRPAGATPPIVGDGAQDMVRDCPPLAPREPAGCEDDREQRPCTQPVVDCSQYALQFSPEHRQRDGHRSKAGHSRRFPHADGE